MAQEKKLYHVSGVVRQYDEHGQIVKTVKNEETMAVSEKQAKAHILSRCKKEMGLIQATKMIFEGRAIEVA